jgi:hypothetical protein
VVAGWVEEGYCFVGVRVGLDVFGGRFGEGMVGIEGHFEDIAIIASKKYGFCFGVKE